MILDDINVPRDRWNQPHEREQLARLAAERGLRANSVRTARTYVLALRRRWQDHHLDDGTETETHALRIRPGVSVVVVMPVDLTTVEAERVGAWISLMGYG